MNTYAQKIQYYHLLSFNDILPRFLQDMSLFLKKAAQVLSY